MSKVECSVCGHSFDPSTLETGPGFRPMCPYCNVPIEAGGTEIEKQDAHRVRLWALYERVMKTDGQHRPTPEDMLDLRKLLEDTAFLHTVKSQTHPHVVATMDKVKEVLKKGGDVFSGDLRDMLKAIEDAEKKAAFWRETKFRPCYEVYATNPPKPTCHMLRDIKRELEMCEDAEDFCIWLGDLLKAELGSKGARRDG